MIKTDEQMKAEAVQELSIEAMHLEEAIDRAWYSEECPEGGIALALDHVARALLLQAEIELCKLRWGERINE